MISSPRTPVSRREAPEWEGSWVAPNRSRQLQSRPSARITCEAKLLCRCFSSSPPCAVSQVPLLSSCQRQGGPAVSHSAATHPVSGEWNCRQTEVGYGKLVSCVAACCCTFVAPAILCCLDPLPSPLSPLSLFVSFSPS